MIHLLPSVPIVARNAPTPATAPAADRDSRWFDGEDHSYALRIGSDVPATARGLGAAGHAERVLAALMCSSASDPA